MNKKIQKISKHAPSIFQGRLDMSLVSTPHTALSIEYPTERIILNTLIGLLVACIAGYFYFVAASVVHVMNRKEALTESSRIESTISTLENRYFALSHAITPSSGTSLGLAPIAKIDYVHRVGRVGIGDIALNKAI